MSRGKTAAQACRRLLDTPKSLFPSSRSSGTKRPISGPATYQGQGRVSQSIAGEGTGNREQGTGKGLFALGGDLRRVRGGARSPETHPPGPNRLLRGARLRRA